MSLTPETLIERASDLPSLPDIYFRVKSVVAAPNASMNDVAAVVAHDPAIAARLLKLANSAFFGLRARVDTLGRAVNLIGTRQIQDLVLASAVTETFSHVASSNFTMHAFWLGSVHAGLLAQAASRACGLADAERHFVVGLLHDLGHLVIDQAAPDELAAALALAEQRGCPLATAELETFGFDHAAVGGALLARWQLPPNLVDGVRWQRDPAAATAHPLDAAIAHLAVVLLEAHRAGVEPTAARDRIAPAALEATGVTDDLLVSVSADAADALTATFDLLFPELPAGH